VNKREVKQTKRNYL